MSSAGNDGDRSEVRVRGPIRLVVVEDEPLYRDLLCGWLERAGFVVVGVFADPVSALHVTPALGNGIAFDGLILERFTRGSPITQIAGLEIEIQQPASGIGGQDAIGIGTDETDEQQYRIHDIDPQTTPSVIQCTRLAGPSNDRNFIAHTVTGCR